MFVEGTIKIGTRTKDLVKYLSADEIAVIQHDDIDELAAEALIQTRVKAVINTGRSMTGTYFSRGTSLLVKSSISIYDTSLKLGIFKDGDFIKIKDKDLILNNNSLYSNSCTLVNYNYIQQKLRECNCNYVDQLAGFVDNTLEFAIKEKNYILNYNNYPELNTTIRDRCAVIVIRSADSHESLLSLKDFIEESKPVLIGVDGGADIIASCGLIPDILIGDMDSVSDVGIYRSREVLLHAYTDGRCPCLSRIATLNVKYKLVPMIGTSEDIAILLAYDKGASQIILIGGHSCMTDFLERGRQGMGSTLITRLKAEDKLIDYKHIRKLQQLTEGSKVSSTTSNEGGLLWMKM